MFTIRLSPWQLSLASATLIVALNNTSLFATLVQYLDLLSARGIGFFLTLVVLMIFLLNTIFLVFGIGRLQKPLIATFLIATALFSFFSSELGVIFHEEMFLNAVETVRDHNSAEALELFSLPLIKHVFLLGVLPSLLLFFVKITSGRVIREIGTRVIVTAMSVALLAVITLPNYKYVTYFGIEHRDLRVKVMPIYPLRSLVRLVRNEFHEEKPFRVIDPDATRHALSTKRSIGIMVVGETARADHFSLNNYGKETNPALKTEDGILFAHAASCGTSTLVSVPCMFAMTGHDSYTSPDATGQSNVLDILTTAGVKVVWIENNSSCKNVCDRIETVDLRRDPDPSSPLYSDMGYFDEVFLREVEPLLSSDGPDILIVLHTLGSHGPAYSRRYPSQFGVFTPYCDKASPQECSDEAVSNAYDNTIVYTDYVLQQLVQKLKSRTDEFDSFLFYASDHGESLGEGGIYLHGLPYAVAPAAQTEVPFIAWFSPGFLARNAIGDKALHRFTNDALSHDNVAHTLLGLYNVDARSYQKEMDIFSTT